MSNGEKPRQPRVFLVNGSPERSGCTHTALSIIANALAAVGVDSQIFWIGNRQIAECIGCRRCATTGRCVFDDVVEEFLDEAPDYDGFVFGSPVHFSGISSGMKAFMDRAFYSSRIDDPFRLKPAAVVVSSRRAGSTSAIEQLDKYLELREMPIVTSRYWNEVHGYTPEDVFADKEGVEVLQCLAKNMAWMLSCIRAARDVGIEAPRALSASERTYTNFMR